METYGLLTGLLLRYKYLIYLPTVFLCIGVLLSYIPKKVTKQGKRIEQIMQIIAVLMLIYMFFIKRFI